MSCFVSQKEKQQAVEVMESILKPIMNYLNNDTKEIVSNALGVLREADVTEDADIKKWNVIADKIEFLLIKVGQEDRQFKPGEFIKYKPTDVANIIRDNVLELEG